jgi:hypothetical protein
MPGNVAAGGEKFTDQERAGLSDAELEALDADDESAEDLAAIAATGDGADDDDGDDDPNADPDAKAAAALKAKEEAEEKAREAAEKKAADAAEAKAKTEADAKVKAAADAAAEAAKKAGGDAEAQKKAREAAEAAARAEATAAADAADAAAAAAAETGTDADADADAELDDYVAPYVAPAPENYDQRMKDLEAREEAATAKFQKGEDDAYDLGAMLKEHRKIATERAELQAQMERHKTTAEIADQEGQRRWKWEVSRFMKDVRKHEGIDYADSIKLNSALDAEVKALAGKEENADKPGEWFLREAHKKVKATFKIADKGTTPDAKAAAAKAAAAKKATEEAARKRAQASGKDKVKPNLGGLPAAGDVDLGKDGEGEFSEAEALMEKGDSMKLEAYIAGKSAEWQERWARHS